MIIRSLKTDLESDGFKTDVTVIAELNLTTLEYEDLHLLFRSQTSPWSSNNNVRLNNIITNIVTADIVERNRENEDFLLSLLKQNVGVVAKEDTFPFEEYAQRNLKEFCEKYKLLIEG